jgi:cytochrome o ubiquinol oxidase operon protein cyoD
MSDHHHIIDSLSSGTSPKTLSAYITGLVLCIILTCASFALVGKHILSGADLYIGLSILALVQLLVQVICFLRLNASAEGQWNLMPFLFALLVVLILVAGSLWIMYNLNYNMMN